MPAEERYLTSESATYHWCARAIDGSCAPSFQEELQQLAGPDLRMHGVSAARFKQTYSGVRGLGAVARQKTVLDATF